MRKVLLGTLAVLLCVGSAQAAITLTVTQLGAVAPGLQAVKITAADSGGAPVTVLSDINLTDVHNVAPAFSTGVHQVDGPTNSWATPPGDANVAWQPYDTYLMVPNAMITGQIGALGEVNDGSDPATLGLMGSFAPPTVGMGSFGHTVGVASSIGVAGAGASLDIIYAVGPTSTTGLLDIGIVYGASSEKDEFVDFPVPFVPEPATMGLLAIGGVALLRRRR